MGDWPVAVAEDKKGLQPIAGRVCAVKKSKAAAERARARAERDSRRGGHQVQPETLEATEYIFVFTTLAAHGPAPAIFEIYRGRWQVELSFKRLKSLLALGHLKKVDPQGAKAWLQDKLFVAILDFDRPGRPLFSLGLPARARFPVAASGGKPR